MHLPVLGIPRVPPRRRPRRGRTPRRTATVLAVLAASLVTCAASGAHAPAAVAVDAAPAAGDVLGTAGSTQVAGDPTLDPTAQPSPAPTPAPATPAASASPAPTATAGPTDSPTGSPSSTPASAVAAAPTPRAKIPAVQASGPQPSSSPAHPGGSAAPATPAPPPPTRRVDWGVYEPQFPGSIAAVSDVEGAVGRHADIVMWYVHWGGQWAAFNASDVQSVIDHGSTPLISWMSDDPSVSGYPDVSTQTAYTDSAVASGRYDAYIRSWATGLRDIGKPVMLRLDFEMNGNWQSWSPGVNGQTAQDFVAMWRHVHDVFAGVGATNVEWVWCPNISYPGSSALGPLYPGDAYVDRVGMDGYNWGPSFQYHTWQSFDSIFDTTIGQITAITGRPMMICEVASTEVGGSKAAWIQDFFAALVSHANIVAFVWFDVNKETDWRIASSAASQAAFVAGLKRVT